MTRPRPTRTTPPQSLIPAQVTLAPTKRHWGEQPPDPWAEWQRHLDAGRIGEKVGKERISELFPGEGPVLSDAEGPGPSE